MSLEVVHRTMQPPSIEPVHNGVKSRGTYLRGIIAHDSLIIMCYPVPCTPHRQVNGNVFVHEEMLDTIPHKCLFRQLVEQNLLEPPLAVSPMTEISGSLPLGVQPYYSLYVDDRIMHRR